MRRYEEPQIKCAMFSSESISAAANASQTAEKIDLKKWLNDEKKVMGVAVVKWAQMEQ